MHNITAIIGILTIFSSVIDYFILEIEMKEVVAGSEGAVGMFILVYSNFLEGRQRRMKRKNG